MSSNRVWMAVLGLGLGTGCATTPETLTVAEPSSSFHARPAQRQYIESVRARFVNIPLVTHEGNAVRFYDDLIKDKVVVLYFMFTTCPGICPAMTGNMVAVGDLFGDRLGRDIHFVTLTLTPEIDTPEVLNQYARDHGTKTGWTFVTGDEADINALRWSLGNYDPDPLIDANIHEHTGLVIFGNDRTGRYRALPGTMPPEQIVKAIDRISRDHPRRN